MKLQHRSGLFADGGGEYYLEYTKSPFKLVCKHLEKLPDVDVSSTWNNTMVNNNIKEGSWVEYTHALCPICEEGNLNLRTGVDDVEYKGVIAPVKYHFTECNACGSVLAGMEEATLNKKAVIAFYKQVDDNLKNTEEN